MRSTNFTFKKTRKVVEKHQGVCLDLTLPEAESLLKLATFRLRNGGYDVEVTKLVEGLVGQLNARIADGRRAQ